jgi:hypothetical protein
VTRTRGTTDVRNTQLHALLTALQQLKFYVQQAADADVENAITIIESSGMSVKRPAVRTKADFAVTQDPRGGPVHLSVRSARKRAAYHWQCSKDGTTYEDLPSTLAAETTVDGLEPGTTYSFRFATLTKTGESQWTRVIRFVVR